MHSSDSESHGATTDPTEARRESDPSKQLAFPIRMWNRLDLNMGTMLMMIKGALPPAISIALYQWDAFANHFSTIGYLVAIMSILSFAIMPRAKFVQTMTFNVLGICIGSAVALLQIYCTVEARAHTTPQQPRPTGGAPSPGARLTGYNPSASAVCAIWLFFNIYVVNTLRAARPQLQFPAIMYSIFTVVTSTYAPNFPTMGQGIAFVKQLLEAFLAGFGIAAFVSFIVFPMTSRGVVFKQAAGYIAALQQALKVQSSYLQSLEDKGAFDTVEKADESDDSRTGKSISDDLIQNESKPSSQAASLKTATRALGETYGKIVADLAFAKRELAYGKLSASEIGELVRLLRMIMLPIIGMSSVIDIFDRVAEIRGWRVTSGDTKADQEASNRRKDTEKSDWSEIMRSIHQPFNDLTLAMDSGLQHALYTLELGQRPKNESGQNVAQAASGVCTSLIAIFRNRR